MKRKFDFYNGYVKNRRFISFALAFLYAMIYDYIVRKFLSDMFAYLLDYTYHPMNQVNYWIYVVVCTLPILFYKGYNQVAVIFSFFCYIFVFIPFVNTLFVAGYPTGKTIPFIALFFLAQCFFFATDHIQFGKRLYSDHKMFSFKQFELLVVVLFLIAIALNISKMHFVNIFSNDQKSLLYDLRAENRSTAGAFNSYLCIWLNHILIPILMVCYLKEKKYIQLGLAFIGMIMMFMIDMQKISFLIPFVIVIFYYLYKRYPKGYLENFHIMMIVALIILPLLVMNHLNNPICFTIASILIMRTQCVEGREFATYFDFFEMHDNPYTYYTHINIIEKITGLYPYEASLGYTVSYGDGNSNANFFLMDGIAAGGFIGCIIAALAFFVFKSYFNTIGNNYDKGLCVIILFFPISSLMNVSLFTALLTGGFLLFYLICRTVDLSILSNKSIDYYE